mgnify:CR=1 FL=1
MSKYTRWIAFAMIAAVSTVMTTGAMAEDKPAKDGKVACPASKDGKSCCKDKDKKSCPAKDGKKDEKKDGKK